MGLPFCRCRCGKEVSKSENQYIRGHSRKGRETSKGTRKKQSLVAKEKFRRDPDLRKKYGWNSILTYEKLLERYRFLFDYEEIQKCLVTRRPKFRCKNCSRWFVPSRPQIYERVRALKMNIGLIHNFLYCSDKCKKENRFYNRHSDPEGFDKLQEYRMLVYRQTEKSLRDCKGEVTDIERRGREFHLDHKYSVYEGFLNNVSPEIVGHWKNLQILSQVRNISKSSLSSISLSNLVGEINRNSGYGE